VTPEQPSALDTADPSARNATDRLLVAAEVADMLAVTERWVREHTRSGLIPCVRLGKYVRYRADTVLAWVAEQETGGATWRKHRPRAEAPPRRDAS
jgi:excisionase family DNA binding protein